MTIVRENCSKFSSQKTIFLLLLLIDLE